MSKHDKMPQRSIPLDNGALDDNELALQLTELSATVDPDPAFVSRLEAQLRAAHSNVEKEQQRLPTRLFQLPVPQLRGRWQAAVIGALLALILLLIVTPPSRAALLSFINGLMLVESPTLATESVEVGVPVIPNGAIAISNTAEITELAVHRVPIPTHFQPGNLVFTGGWVEDDPKSLDMEVTLVFHPAGEVITPASPYLLISASTDTDVMPVLPQEEAQSVRVNGLSGLYWQGRWQGDPVGDSGEQINNIRWDKEADAGWLSWHEHNLNILIVADGLELEQDALIQMAEKLSWQ